MEKVGSRSSDVMVNRCHDSDDNDILIHDDCTIANFSIMTNKTARYNPFFCFFIAIGNALWGSIRFSREHVGNILRMDDGHAYTVFRQVSLTGASSSQSSEPATASPPRPPTTAVFIARFKFARFSQRCNRILSLIPIPLIVGFPGFQEKIWMVDEETGYWQGVYQWESERAIEAYQQSFVLGVMNKRAVQASISYTILPNTRLSEYVKRRLVKGKAS